MHQCDNLGVYQGLWVMHQCDSLGVYQGLWVMHHSVIFELFN